MLAGCYAARAFSPPYWDLHWRLFGRPADWQSLQAWMWPPLAQSSGPPAKPMDTQQCRPEPSCSISCLQLHNRGWHSGCVSNHSQQYWDDQSGISLKQKFAASAGLLAALFRGALHGTLQFTAAASQSRGWHACFADGPRGGPSNCQQDERATCKAAFTLQPALHPESTHLLNERCN